MQPTARFAPCPSGSPSASPPCGRAPAVSVLPEADTSRPEHPAAQLLLFSLTSFLGPSGPNPARDSVPLRLPLRPPQAPGALTALSLLRWSALAAWESKRCRLSTPSSRQGGNHCQGGDNHCHPCQWLSGARFSHEGYGGCGHTYAHIHHTPRDLL